MTHTKPQAWLRGSGQCLQLWTYSILYRILSVFGGRQSQDPKQSHLNCNHSKKLHGRLWPSICAGGAAGGSSTMSSGKSAGEPATQDPPVEHQPPWALGRGPNLHTPTSTGPKRLTGFTDSVGYVASPGVRGGFHGSDAQRAHVEAMRLHPRQFEIPWTK